MRRFRAPSAAAAVAVLAATICAGVPTAAARGPGWGDDAAKAYGSGSLAFAVDLLHRIGAKPGNVFYSPFSLTMALAMTRTGARGETADQMRTVLHLPGDEEAIRAFLPSIFDLRSTLGEPMHGVEPAYALISANAVFLQTGWPFEPAFRKAVAEDYAAEFQEVEFRAPGAARRVINNWVEAKTKGRIKDIVPDGMPPADTRMALSNAIHFKAQWETAFREQATAPAAFTVKAGTDVQVPTMHRTHSLRWSETDDAMLVEIPYRRGHTSMVVVLPKARDGLDDVVRALTGERFANAIATMAPRKIALSLPKFAFTSRFDAASVLAQMGMAGAFSPTKADFSGITKEEKLFIGAVLHKAFVAVDENGTEAAAATVVAMRAGSAPHPDEPLPFVVDHPFLFVIRHAATGAPLFMGRVDDPTAK